MAFVGTETWRAPKAKDGTEKRPRWECSCGKPKENFGNRFACRQCDWEQFGTTRPKPDTKPAPVRREARRSPDVIDISALMSPRPAFGMYR